MRIGTKSAKLLVVALAASAAQPAVQAATYDGYSIVGPVQSVESQYGELDDRIARILAMRAANQAAPASVTDFQPVEVQCVPAETESETPSRIVSEPLTPDYQVPDYLSPALRARVLALRSRMLGPSQPTLVVSSPVRSAPICPEEEATQVELLALRASSIEPFDGDLPSVQPFVMETMNVPEPGTLGLLGIGLAGLGLSRRRRKA